MPSGLYRRCPLKRFCDWGFLTASTFKTRSYGFTVFTELFFTKVEKVDVIWRRGCVKLQIGFFFGRGGMGDEQLEKQCLFEGFLRILLFGECQLKYVE